MRQHAFHTLALLLVLAGAAHAVPAAPQEDRVDAFIRAEMQSQNIPGLSLAVVKDGKVIKAAGYGLANIKHNTPATPETVYKIASVSKQFIATGIMLLAQDGRLSIDDPVSKYLEDTPPAWQGITLRHLLTHTSGLVREAPGFDPHKTPDEAELIKTAYQAPLRFAPGEKWEYGNTGYNILAAVITKAAGEHWTQYLQRRVFTPAGMNTTFPTNVTLSIPNRAQGYADNDKLLDAPEWQALRPSGAFLSTVLDLAKWDAMLYSEQILADSTRRLMWTPVTLNNGASHPYGFGWQLGTLDGHRVVRHSGGMPGTRAHFARFVDDRLTIVMLMNLDDVDIETLWLGVARIYLPPESKPRPAPAQGREWMFGPFEKPRAANPVITADRDSKFLSPMNDSLVSWEEYATFNPAAVVKDGKVFLLYRAEDATGKAQIGHHTSRIGLAESADGLRFTRRSTPVLYPDKDAQAQYEWPGGVEDPRIVESEDGRYLMTYTQWNRDTPRLAIATSTDLIHWSKHGPAFAKAASGKYRDMESKSGAIVSRVSGNRIVATRVNGKYWMYFNVPDILLATSDNLIDWTLLEDENGKPLKVLSARPGYFDSWLVEAGPPALITAHGIVILYNAGNSKQHGDARLPHRVYTGGQALFDTQNPWKLIDRADEPFITPTEDYERTGQYAEGTTFVEGLVHFKGRWFLYYGTADSRVGVAVWDQQR